MLPPLYEACRTLEEYSLDYHADDSLRRKHLWHRIVYRKGCWATLLACYCDWGLQGWSGGWHPPTYKLVRMRKIDGLWRPQRDFNLNRETFEALGLHEKLQEAA